MWLFDVDLNKITCFDLDLSKITCFDLDISKMTCLDLDLSKITRICTTLTCFAQRRPFRFRPRLVSCALGSGARRGPTCTLPLWMDPPIRCLGITIKTKRPLYMCPSRVIRRKLRESQKEELDGPRLLYPGDDIPGSRQL